MKLQLLLFIALLSLIAACSSTSNVPSATAVPAATLASPVTSVPNIIPTLAFTPTVASAVAPTVTTVLTPTGIITNSGVLSGTGVTSPTIQTGNGYDGQWLGTITDGQGISFTIASGIVYQIEFTYFVTEGNCAGLSGSYPSIVEAPIEDAEFEIEINDGSYGEIEVDGEFLSTTLAQGEIKVERAAPSCGEYKYEGNWEATRMP